MVGKCPHIGSVWRRGNGISHIFQHCKSSSLKPWRVLAGMLASMAGWHAQFTFPSTKLLEKWGFPFMGTLFLNSSSITPRPTRTTYPRICKEENP